MQTRRSFFKTLGATGTGFVGATTSASASSTPEADNSQLAMLYDATRCIGCKACMAACKRVNTRAGALEVEKASFDEDALWDAPAELSGKSRTIIKLHRDEEEWSFVKQSCMHCQKPSCVSACPVKAMHKDPVTGIVQYSRDTCIGCRYCQIACPFNIPKFQWDKNNPQIVKCDMCISTNLRDKGTTACAEACSAGAILFGRRGDLLKEAHRRIEQKPSRYYPKVYGEHEIGGTNHLYIAGLPFEKIGLPTLGTEAPATASEEIQHTIYKGFFAPVALYAGLCAVAVRNMRRNGNGDPEPSGEDPGAADESAKR
jgi:Fe-S-cluster-containing dehydrogenase component